jgi:hypothetical protein
MTAGLCRRALFALGSGAALTACGFQPVYMPTASGQPGPAERELAAIYVNLLPDRPGMMLRQALQDRFEGAGGAVARRYDLTVAYGILGELQGIQPDTTVTRLRLVGIASWVLTAEDPAHTRLINGTAHAIDAANMLDSQLFALDLENEAIQKQLAEALADQITLQLGAFFRKRAAANPTS